MSTSDPRHLWLVSDIPGAAGTTTDIDIDLARGADLYVRSHRRRRGPYTAGGELLRRAVPELLAVASDRVGYRAAEIEAMAADLRPLIPLPPQTLTNTSAPKERTRFYAFGRTARLAHGVAELLTEWARTCHPGGVVVELDELAEADATDLELVAVLLRRCDPRDLQLRLWMSAVVADLALEQQLAVHARRVVVAGPAVAIGPRRTDDPAEEYFETDGLDCGEQARAAYLALTEDERARRHNMRAERLERAGGVAVRLGPVGYHRERGLDAATTGARALLHAADDCFALGYYPAAMEFAERGRALVAVENDPGLWGAFTHKIGACLAYLGRGDEGMPYFAALRASTTDPVVQMNCAYLHAMLYTRLLPKELHDEDVALQSVNAAIAFADILPDPKDRVFFGAFMRNGRALVDLHRRDFVGALAQVNRAIEITDAAFGVDEHRLHRSILRYNRGQVLAAIGEYESALTDYDEAILRDPEYGDYYFDRAALHRAAGHDEKALADYATAIALTPPFYEAHYNRADLLRQLGRDDEARRDLDYALELEPTHVESLLARADLALEQGDLEQAAIDIDTGLARDPDHPHLFAALGSLLAELGDVDAAVTAYTSALERDSGLTAALVNRAVLRFGAGAVTDAVDDLDLALAVRDDPTVRANRAIALQELGRHEEALDDLDSALTADVGDRADLLYRRGASRYALADPAGAALDWEEYLQRFPTGPHAAEIALRSPAVLDFASST